MIISGMVKNSLVDYPGLIACVLFVPGCNYDCFFCHNRPLIEGNGVVLDEEKVFGFLKKRAGLLDAVVVSGGEPTLQEGLAPFMQKLRAMGYRVKLDTNGSSPRTVRALLDGGACDYFAVDYKAPRAKYREFCGPEADADKVLETIRLLAERGADFEVRTTVFPQLREEDLLTMAKELPPVPRYALNRYRVPETYKPADRARVLEKPHMQDEIDRFAERMAEYQPGMFRRK